MNIRPIDVIAAIRIGIINSNTRFTEGGCFQLYRILKHLYPNAEAWYNGIEGHVYTKIDANFYDINGILVQDITLYPLESEPMVLAKAYEWDFK